MAMNNEVETIVEEKVQEYLMRWIQIGKISLGELNKDLLSYLAKAEKLMVNP